MRDDEWQLEMLCNIAAGEILMPVAHLPVEHFGRLSIDDLLSFQENFDVSMEAVLLRAVRFERKPCAVFVASPFTEGYRLDYAVETESRCIETAVATSSPPQLNDAADSACRKTRPKRDGGESTYNIGNIFWRQPWVGNHSL